MTKIKSDFLESCTTNFKFLIKNHFQKDLVFYGMKGNLENGKCPIFDDSLPSLLQDIEKSSQCVYLGLETY